MSDGQPSALGTGCHPGSETSVGLPGEQKLYVRRSDMRSRPYHDELHTFRRETEHRRLCGNEGWICAVAECRCSHDMMITPYSSVFLSTCPNHLSPVSLFSLMFATPALALMSSFLIFSIIFSHIIHLNSLMSVLSSKSCSSFLSARVSLPYIITGPLTVLLVCHLA